MIQLAGRGGRRHPSERSSTASAAMTPLQRCRSSASCATRPVICPRRSLLPQDVGAFQRQEIWCQQRGRLISSQIAARSLNCSGTKHGMTTLASTTSFTDRDPRDRSSSVSVCVPARQAGLASLPPASRKSLLSPGHRLSEDLTHLGLERAAVALRPVPRAASLRCRAARRPGSAPSLAGSNLVEHRVANVAHRARIRPAATP